ncbi:MAG TPA: hypothetical protein VHO25_10075 [Polyangiaceae bacterium]|nr:hypothetical protein [Polyangiaceae bacterium]
MVHAARFPNTAWLRACTALVCALVLPVVSCGQYPLVGDDGEPPAAEGASVQDLLNAWSAARTGPQVDHPETATSAPPAPQASPQDAADPREATVASGVVSGTESDRRPTSNHRSGSRLHVRAVLTEQGQQSWMGWRDTERGEDCAFQRDAAGTLRCLPSAVTNAVFFADPACAVRVAMVDTSEVSYAAQRETSQCNAGVRIYPLRGAIETPTSLFATDDSGRCFSVTVPSAALFRAVGDEVPPTEFVSGLEGVEDTDARVKAVGLTAEDGATSVTGFVDSELQTPCVWEGTRQAVCVPQATPVSTFADELCSLPLLLVDRNTCTPEVTFGAVLESESCELTYYRPGAAFLGSTVYEVTEQSYESREVPGAEAMTMLQGVRVARDALAPGNLERLAGAITRLSAQHWTTPDHGVWFSSWYDNALETECSFMQSGEDEWQCLPTDTGHQVLFADAACNQPIVEMQAVDACGNPISAPRFVTESVADTRGRTVQQVRRVLSGRPFLATVYRLTGQDCEAQTIADNRVHYDLSQPLPTSSFVRGHASVL